MDQEICERHRKELLRFLLLKTAAVRGGVKPGELLRVRHCYESRNAEGFRFCLYRQDILEILKLDYLELRVEPESSLVIFYHPAAMRAALQCMENRSLLTTCGYPAAAEPAVQLAFLQQRFAERIIPHEVGVFIGYPAKDVSGFIRKLPRTPIHKGDWAVFGDALESLERMRLYRGAERIARNLLESCDDLQTFFDRVAKIGFNGAFSL